MNENRSTQDQPASSPEIRAGEPGSLEGGNASAFEALLEAANRRADAAVSQQRAMQDSISWRMTAPLRKVSTTVPPSVRVSLRRMAKAAWWAMTPWRMPQRLRTMRVKPRMEDVLSGSLDPRDAYGRWIAHAERRNPIVGDLSVGPSLSFVMAAGSDARALSRTIESLRSQHFARWQAIVAVGPLGTPAILSVLDSLSKEPRIVRVAAESESRTQALAACMTHASGEFVAVLDAGDIVAAGALAEIAGELARLPHSDILYGDEDQISVDGLRGNPYFKPGWSPDLLYAFNYFGRLTLLRRQLVVTVGGVDADSGAEVEWDLNLRASEAAGTITRIPKVLCHRVPAGAARDRANAQTQAAAENREALRRYWARSGVDATISTQPDGTQRATWEIAAPPKVSIIIPTKDKIELLRICMEGLLRGTDYTNREIILVDTGSVEAGTWAYYEELADQADVSIVHFGKKFNYSAACNYGASFARGDLFLFLNNDIEVVSRDWLQELVRFACRPGVGVVGTKLRYPNGQLQHGGVGIGINLGGLMYRAAEEGVWGIFGSPDHPRNWMAIMGACQLVRRDAFERVGGFDEAYLVAVSDVMLCLRIWRAGYRIAYAPHACLVHHEGATRGNVNPTPDLRRFADDLRTLGIDEDPYLHPELDARNPIPSVRLPDGLTVRETLAADVRALGSSMLPASTLVLSCERTCLEAAGLGRQDVMWLPQAAHAIKDIWSAARWCLDLLRTCPDIARRFPTALSEGVNGEFGRWILGEGGERLHLSNVARTALTECLATDVAARARQAFLFHDEIRSVLPHGLLPAGQFELFQWFMRRGRGLAGLRFEEVWWLLWEASEQPARELMRAYAFTPAWQELYPDGLTFFGRRAFSAWFSSAYRVTDPWIDPSRWPVDMGAAQQIRLAYLARKDWSLRHPQALDDPQHATLLIDWLQTPEAGQSPEVVEWCAGLDANAVGIELSELGLNVIGHFSYPSGLRVSVEALVQGLRRVGVRSSLRDLRTDRKDDPTHASFRGFEEFDSTLIHVQPEPYFDQAFARSDLYERAPRTHRIAYWYWEFDCIPESWVAHAQNIDEAWAATEFVARGLRKRLSPLPVYTLFPGVQLGHYEKRPRSYFGLRQTPYTFLFTFHMMSVMERKNPLGLIRAFELAFGASDAVQLVLKTSFGDRHPVQFQELQAAARASNITIINEVYSQEDVLSLMDACDAYVSLHRSEGLGLTMAEAMLMGKPVIATNFSGNVDFMDEGNSLPVDYKLVKLGKAIPPYDAHLEWAEPSEEHAAQQMQHVFNNQAWAAELGARAKANAELTLSVDVAGRKAAARLAEIKAQRCSGRAGGR